MGELGRGWAGGKGEAVRSSRESSGAAAAAPALAAESALIEAGDNDVDQPPGSLARGVEPGAVEPGADRSLGRRARVVGGRVVAWLPVAALVVPVLGAFVLPASAPLNRAAVWGLALMVSMAGWGRLI